MSKEEETDAANVLSQMSQLVGFDHASSIVDTETMLDEVGATCTLQPSSLDSEMLFSLPDDNASKNANDAFITFDDADHPYAASILTESYLTTKSRSATPPDLLKTSKKRKTIKKKPFHSDLIFDLRKFDRTKEKEPCYLIIQHTSKNVIISFHPPNAGVFRKKIVRSEGLALLEAAYCVVCDKTFKSSYTLKVHLRFHTGEKPFKCSLCENSFTTKSDLKRHGMVHKLCTKYFKCEVCDSTLRDQASLTRHMKKHLTTAAMKCLHCDRSFDRLDCLNNHLNTHDVKKSFVCEFCSTTFLYKSSYTRHLKTHSKEKINCPICNKAFRRKDVMNKHIKSKHDKTHNTKRGNNILLTMAEYATGSKQYVPQSSSSEDEIESLQEDTDFSCDLEVICVS